jgi:oligosaccharide repeat unit polymerase
MHLNNFFLKQKFKGILFLKSLLIGFLIWVSCYIFTPFNVVNPLSSEVIWFITLNYLSLIFGYFFVDIFFNRNKNIVGIQNTYLLNNSLYLLIFLIYFSSIIRYFDLFFVRDISFFNSISTNKYNVAQDANFSLVLGVLAIFRFLYFVPYLFYLIEKRNKRKLLMICVLLFLVPVIEGYLRGSRRLFFESIGVFITITCVYNMSKVFSKKIILIGVFSLILSVLFSNFVLKERIKENNEMFFLEKIYNSPYNDFLPLKDETKQFIVKNKGNLIGKASFNSAHFGQHIVHGVYEFDKAIKEEAEKKMGMYNGFILVKFLNKLGLTNIPLELLMNPTGRVTYITFFGGQFLDFGWYSLIIMFFYGGIQNYFFVKGSTFNYLKPFVIIFIFSNVFLLTFNFMRAQFILTFGVYFVLVVLIKVCNNKSLI